LIKNKYIVNIIITFNRYISLSYEKIATYGIKRKTKDIIITHCGISIKDKHARSTTKKTINSIGEGLIVLKITSFSTECLLYFSIKYK
jgi:hypothetical protein